MGFDWDRSLFKKSSNRSSSLDLKSIEDSISKAISDAKASSGFKKKKSFSPSAFGGSGVCPRYWHFAFNGTTFEDAPDALGVFAMEFGTIYGDKLEERLVEAGVAAARQQSVSNIDPPVFGYLDFIGVSNEQEYVADLKTVGDEKFEKIRSEGVPPDAHMIQILLYMRILKYKSGMLIYVNRDSGKMCIIPISISEKNKLFVEYVFNWMRDVKKWADGEVIPSRAFPKSNWVCKGCAVKEICDKTENVKKVGPGKLEIDITKLEFNEDV